MTPLPLLPLLRRNIMKLILDGKPVSSFTGEYGYKYVIDKRACNSLNKVLNTNFKAVYRKGDNLNENQWSFPNISMDFETVYILRDDDKVVSMAVSEWFTLSMEG